MKLEPHMTPETREQRLDALGRALARPLAAQADALAPEITDRLEHARMQAVAAARAAREANAMQVDPTGQATLAGPGGRRRLGLAWLPALVLVAGLVALSQGQWLQQVFGTGEVDAELLKDQLPPNAYGDPGFYEYLEEDGKKRPEDHPEADERDKGA